MHGICKPSSPHRHRSYFEGLQLTREERADFYLVDSIVNLLFRNRMLLSHVLLKQLMSRYRYHLILNLD